MSNKIPKTGLWIVLGVACAVALCVMPGEQHASASIPMGVAAELGHTVPDFLTTVGNTSVRCPLDIAWNQDAGPSTGRVVVGRGATSFNLESESTTPVWMCWHTGTTRANYQTVCRKRCVGCNNGATYQAEAQPSGSDFFCLASAGTDAGVVLSVEYGR